MLIIYEMLKNLLIKYPGLYSDSLIVYFLKSFLSLLHSERPKHNRVFAVLSAIGLLKSTFNVISHNYRNLFLSSVLCFWHTRPFSKMNFSLSTLHSLCILEKGLKRHKPKSQIKLWADCYSINFKYWDIYLN